MLALPTGCRKSHQSGPLSEKVEFPFIHNLDILRGLLPEGWAVLDSQGDLYDLTEWAVEARYPGAASEPTHEDAARAESRARSIYDSVAGEFKRRGILV